MTRAEHVRSALGTRLPERVGGLLAGDPNSEVEQLLENTATRLPELVAEPQGSRGAAMTRTYRLLRFIPDPVRGESLNVAVIGQDGSSYRVLAVEDAEVSPRLEMLAPHVDAAVLVDFLRELRSSERDPERLEGALSTFDPHFIVEEPLRLGAHRPFEEQLSAAFRDLVATSRRRSKHKE